MISFNSSWPLVSYSSKVESKFGSSFEERLKENCNYETVIESVEELYNEKIYLDRLFPRFWKLSIKFIERFIDMVYSKSKSLVEDPMVASLHAEHLMEQQPIKSFVRS